MYTNVWRVPGQLLKGVAVLNLRGIEGWVAFAQ